DESGGTLWYADTDGDGYGDLNDSGVESCNQPPGAVNNNTDCDDTNAAINPNAVEVCDGIDNNCDGQIDESGGTIWYADTDGYGDVNDNGVESCAQPPGTVDNNDDCDDAEATVYPGAPELCDGLDNDCDGIIQEPQLEDLGDQNVTNTFEFPIIDGTNLSGNE